MVARYVELPVALTYGIEVILTFFMGSEHHVLGIVNDYLKRNGNEFTSFHVKLVQNIINISLLQKKMDFATSQSCLI